MVAIEAIAYHQKDSLGGFSDIAGTNWRLLTSTDQIRNSGSAIYDASTVQSIRLAQTNDPTGLTRATLDEAAYYNQVTHEVVIVNLGANQAPEFVAGLATLVTPSFTASEQTKYMIGGDAFPLAVREAVAANAALGNGLINLGIVSDSYGTTNGLRQAALIAGGLGGCCQSNGNLSPAGRS